MPIQNPAGREYLETQDLKLPFITLTDGATITWNLRLGKAAKVTLGGNRTLTLSNVTEGTFGTLEVIQDATGGRTLTNSITSTQFALNATPNGITILSFFFDGTTYFWSTPCSTRLQELDNIGVARSIPRIKADGSGYEFLLLSAALADLQNNVTFNDRAISRYSLETNLQTGTAYTLQSSDNGMQVTFSNTSSITLTVPSGLPVGFNCLITQGNTGVVTVVAGSSVNLFQRESKFRLAGMHAVASLLPTTTINNYLLAGDLVV